MFENLTEKLGRVFKKLRNHGKLSEAVVDEALREVRLALLEADVNFKVAREFTAHVAERAKGQEVMDSLTPAQQVIKIVRDELMAVMGGEASPLARPKHPPAAVMFVGLQGSGKTTSVGKLARYLAKQGHRSLLVACDIHRPAAADQLLSVGRQVDAEVVVPKPGEELPALAVRALERARLTGIDYALFDTAGRLHINEEMMNEVSRLARLITPQEVLFVADAMTGQEAVNVALGFAKALTLTGVILTKFDGDARGGAALSIRRVVGIPVKFTGLGEKMDALEVFHPDRLASRILGMGDVLGLIEKAEAAVDKDEARAMERKLRANQFTLEDFRGNLRMVKKMGSLEDILSHMPGAAKLGQLGRMEADESQLARAEAIINSMTAQERTHHKIINASRRRRIAQGSGTEVHDVNRLIKQFEQTLLVMKRMNKLQNSPGAFKNRGSILNMLKGR